MSIQSEINRINAAKADILAALTEKGVDTTGAGLADIAALVAGIESGGGGGIAFGEVTIAEDSNTLNINHGLGAFPNNFFVVGNYNKEASGNDNFFLSAAYNYEPQKYYKQYVVHTHINYGSLKANMTIYTYDPPYSGTAGFGYYIRIPDENTIIVNKGNSSGFIAGITYIWCAFIRG